MEEGRGGGDAGIGGGAEDAADAAAAADGDPDHEKRLDVLSRDVSDYWPCCHEHDRLQGVRGVQEVVQHLDVLPSAVHMLREYVCKSVPVVLPLYAEGMMSEESCRWAHGDCEELHVCMEGKDVSVALTPHGRADAVVPLPDVGGVAFMEPLTESMTTREFFARLLSKKSGDLDDKQDEEVPYLQFQNDSLRTEFTPLVDTLVPSCLSFAAEVFGSEPDAANVWIGDERSTTSLHKDHYENFFCVLRGSKRFTLLPPTDIAFIPEAGFAHGQYVRSDADGPLVPHMFSSEDGSPSTIRWLDVDTECDAADIAARYPRAHPITCTVHAGECLYLPPLWLHRVEQLATPTVAVNYWHDMTFDCRFILYNMARRLAMPNDTQYA